MNKKIIWIGAGFVIVIALLIGLKKGGVIGKEEGIAVTSEAVQLRTITESVNASGKVYPEIEVKVSPDISGEIVNLFVEEGDRVTKGQVLAKIYADIYSSQRDQVTASVNQVKAQYENVKAGLSGLKTVYENTKATNERFKKLYSEIYGTDDGTFNNSSLFVFNFRLISNLNKIIHGNDLTSLISDKFYYTILVNVMTELYHKCVLLEAFLKNPNNRKNITDSYEEIMKDITPVNIYVKVNNMPQAGGKIIDTLNPRFKFDVSDINYESGGTSTDAQGKKIFNTQNNSLTHFINVRPIELKVNNKTIFLPELLEISKIENGGFNVTPIKETINYFNFNLRSFLLLTNEGDLFGESAAQFEASIFRNEKTEKIIIYKGTGLSISSDGEAFVRINNKMIKIEKLKK